ncbi:cysteine desulfurase DndA [uncultured Shewanella sp.]|uniref:cysteine desulfurase DndA n=1 Tax=uncultured Shewanella sp. TaxID=173975 RepID=UPI00260B0257|nr:cysteine desulfurase DndA [uncultured Shewanella sp.]
MALYLDCNATTQVIEPVADLVCKLMVEEYGNAGSRTHTYGLDAKRYVEKARQQVADVVSANKTDIIFTSGATESNNIAILGLEKFGKETNKTHIITTEIEHKAVLEPILELEKRGFQITWLKPNKEGLINPQDLAAALQDNTLLVSIMFVNNETGCIQPLELFSEVLGEHDAFFHVDAAQGFGKYIEPLCEQRIDMISISGHKVYAPKGIGALVMRKRGYIKPPLTPILFGGGQEKKLRPGTLAVPLIAGLGLSSELAVKHGDERKKHASMIKEQVLELLNALGAKINGSNTSDYVINFSVPELNSEAAMVAFKDVVAVSNGSACTSSSYIPSHVLVAMGMDEKEINGAIRMSWSHMTNEIPLVQLHERIKQLL